MLSHLGKTDVLPQKNNQIVSFRTGNHVSFNKVSCFAIVLVVPGMFIPHINQMLKLNIIIQTVFLDRKAMGITDDESILSILLPNVTDLPELWWLFPEGDQDNH